jgi:molybdate transport system substrate-binding protein
MRMIKVLTAAACLLLGGLAATEAYAGEANVAVAANFTQAAGDLAAAFKAKTGDEVRLSFGSSGSLYTQITQDAPFDILLSADEGRPKKLVADGLGVPSSVFTYAVGKLVLWSRNPDLVKGESTLASAKFEKLSICDPKAAPYGAAAVETMKAVHAYDAIEPKLVVGANVSQAFQFVDTGNAELGFIALSQLSGRNDGSRWEVPQALYTPIRQDAVLLKKGADNPAAAAFVEFLKGGEARAIIEKYGYGFGAGS